MIIVVWSGFPPIIVSILHVDSTVTIIMQTDLKVKLHACRADRFYGGEGKNEHVCIPNNECPVVGVNPPEE